MAIDGDLLGVGRGAATRCSGSTWARPAELGAATLPHVLDAQPGGGVRTWLGGGRHIGAPPPSSAHSHFFLFFLDFLFFLSFLSFFDVFATVHLLG